VTGGALVQEVVSGGPAADAGVREGSRRERFQNEGYRAGGDVIVSVAGIPIRHESDVGNALTGKSPGETVMVVVLRDGARRSLKVRLGDRP
jgi:S1-C subfamily serine protease